MPKRLTDNLNSDYLSAANKLKPKTARRRIVAYVESYDDIYFWRTVLSRFENNSRFMQKTDESIETLTRFADELRGYSRLLNFSDTIQRRHLQPLCSLAYRLTGKAIRRQLTGNRPSLLLFKVYKVLKIVSESKNYSHKA